MALIIHNKAFDKLCLEVTPYQLIKNAVSKDSIDNFILIVPTGKLTKNLKYHSYLEYFNKYQKPCSDVNIMNLDKFTEQIFRQVYKDNSFRVISEAYRLALTNEAALSANLEFYKPNGKKFYHHIIEKLSNIIYGLREDGIKFENMLDDIEMSRTDLDLLRDSKKYSDIAKIFKGYEKNLEERYLDPPALLRKLISYANNYYLNNPNSTNSPFDTFISSFGRNIQSILIYGFSEFKSPETDFLSKFADCKIPIAIHLDFSETNGPLFGNLSETKETLLTAGFDFYYTEDEYNPSVNIKNASIYDTSFSVFLRRWLFNTEKDIKFPVSSKKNLLNIFEFQSSDEEVKSIAKLVKHLIIEKSYKPSDIAVVARNISSYSQQLRESFYLERIPANFSDRYSLSESQIVISVLSVLDTISESFRLSDVIKTLQSSFLNFDTEENQIDLSNLINVTTELRFPKNNIKIGKKNWYKRFENGISYLNNILLQYQNSYSSENDLRLIESRLYNYQKALIDFRQFAESLPEVKPSYTTDDFKNLVIKDIISKFSVKNKIREVYKSAFSRYSDKNAIERDLSLESVEKYSRALAVFENVLDEMLFIMQERKNRKFKLEEYISDLKLIISGAKYQTRDKLNYGVSVTAIEQIREIPFKVTILCGMNDGVFPVPYHPESFLGKEIKESEFRHLHSEQILFYRFLNNGLEEFYNTEKSIYLTYSKFSDTFETARSSFIDSLLKVTDTEVIKFSDLTENSEIGKNYNWFWSISTKPEISEFVANNYIINNIENLKEISIDSELINYISILKERLNLLNSSPFGKLSYLVMNKMNSESNRSFSASDFETFGKCSYQYFAKKIIKLKEEDKTDISIQALDLGNIMHNSVYKFFKKLQENNYSEIISSNPQKDLNLPNLKTVELKSNERNKYLMLLRSIIFDEFEDIKFKHPLIQLAKRQILGDESNMGWAEYFIDNELNRVNKSYPGLFEFEFGYKKSNASIPPIDIGNGIKLLGKIDRVDFSFDKNNNNKMYFTIIDYKTSESGTKNEKDIENGLSYQAPLYSIAIKQILKKHYNVDAELLGAAYFIFKPGNDNDKNKFLKTVLMPSELDWVTKRNKKIINFDDQSILLNKSVENVNTIVSKIANSEISPSPNKPADCTYCSYSSVCRIYEREGTQMIEEFEIPE